MGLLITETLTTINGHWTLNISKSLYIHSYFIQKRDPTRTFPIWKTGCHCPFLMDLRHPSNRMKPPSIWDIIENPLINPLNFENDWPVANLNYTFFSVACTRPYTPLCLLVNWSFYLSVYRISFLWRSWGLVLTAPARVCGLVLNQSCIFYAICNWTLMIQSRN